MSLFDEKYFKGGAESNYVDYNEKLYNNLARDIVKILKIGSGCLVLDFGCATGILVKELSKYCHCYGLDISQWAISHGIEELNLLSYIYHDPEYKLLDNYDEVYDGILMLDVLEHCEEKEIDKILCKCKADIIVRIPVAAIEGQDFLYECSRKDKTHIQCHSKTWWHDKFLEHDYDIFKVIKEKRIYDSDGVLAWQLQKKNLKH